ncbi:hypothetical protein BVRB_5g097820 [Beta vulgaris subsp. vulgaris]|nr:hypothetical protein BVRB_5g097820 [Beta vulgaris subsp. vulgaris]
MQSASNLCDLSTENYISSNELQIKEVGETGLRYAHQYISSISDPDNENSSLIANEAIKELKKFLGFLEDSTPIKVMHSKRVKQGPLPKILGINPKEMLDLPVNNSYHLIASTRLVPTKEFNFISAQTQVMNRSYSNPVLCMEGSTTSSKQITMQSSMSGILSFSEDASTKCASSSRTCHCSKKR